MVRFLGTEYAKEPVNNVIKPDPARAMQNHGASQLSPKRSQTAQEYSAVEGC